MHWPHIRQDSLCMHVYRIAVLSKIWKLIYMFFMVVVVQHWILAFVKDIYSGARHIICFSCASSLVWCRLLISSINKMKSRALIFVLCMRYFFWIFHFLCRLSMMKSECTRKKPPELLSNVKSIQFPGTVFCRHRRRYFCCKFSTFLCVCVRSLHVMFYSLMLVIRFGRSHSVFPYLLRADVMLLNQNDCSHTDIEHYKNPFQLQMHMIFTVHRAVRNCNVSCCGNFR